jgi:uncharacterized membrane protein YhaH (DUF805 family)
MGLILQFMFSFKGRIGRATYLLGGLLPITLTVLLLSMLGVVADPEHLKQGVSAIHIAGLLVALMFLVSTLALGVKRLHDLNKSGWFLIAPTGALMLSGMLSAVMPPVAMLGMVAAGLWSVWMTIQMCFFKGTEGRNDYDHDGGRADAKSAAKGNAAASEPDWVASAMKKASGSGAVHGGGGAGASAGIRRPPAEAGTAARSAGPAKPRPAKSGVADLPGGAAPAGFGRRNR